jgi:hypothetical protein
MPLLGEPGSGGNRPVPAVPAPPDLKRVTPTRPLPRVLQSARPAAAVREVLQGPWEQGFLLVLPMPVRSKANHRHGDSGRNGWKQMKTFEEQVATFATALTPRGWERGATGVPLSQRPAVVAFVFALSWYDPANLPKSVLDACQGPVFHNDKSVIHCASFGIYGAPGDRTLLAFARLNPSPPPRDVVTAAAELNRQCLPWIERLTAGT